MAEIPPGLGHFSPPIITARPVALPAAVAESAPRPLELASLSRRDAALDLVLVLVAALVFPFGASLAAYLLEGGETARPLETGPLVLAKWFDALLVVWLAAYFVYRQRLTSAAFGLQADGLRRQVLWSMPTLLAMYGAMIPMVVAITVLVMLRPELQGDLMRRKEFMQRIPLQSLADTVLLLVPVAIHEELLFRGLLIPYLRRVGCGWTGAILLSSGLFASLHVAQGWLGIVQIFPVGLTLAVFFVLTRSLTAVILAHFLFDLLQTQLARLLWPSLEKFFQNA